MLIKSKDILEQLCKNSNLDYVNILPVRRKNNYWSYFVSFIIKYYKISKIIRSFKPNLLLSSEPAFSHLGKIFNIPSFIFSEDDADIIPLYAFITYPFTDYIISPKVCNAGKWEYKKIGYDGYHKMCYLHPEVFIPNKKLISEKLGDKYFIIRFADLNAYHDNNKNGIDTETAKQIIDLLKPHGRVYITSENELSLDLEKYRIKINPDLIHHALFYSELYIGDSQSMAVEAAILGTPGIRFNDFVGKISVLNELENKYGLTIGINSNDRNKLIDTIKYILNDSSYKKKHSKKMKDMLEEKINVLDFVVDFIENHREYKK